MKLTDDQKRQFLKQGYLVLDNVLPASRLDPVINELNSEIHQRAASLYKNGEISDPYENEPFERRLAKISAETPKLALSIWNNLLHGEGIFKLITTAELLDVIEVFVGPEIVASSVFRLRPKIPNFGYGEVPWHQDSAYFEPFCDDFLIITAWVPLVDADEKNGCLYVIPGSHRREVVKHIANDESNYLQIHDDFLPKENWLPCPVKKGGVLLLTNKTMHGSFKNTTDEVRWSMDLRYQSAKLPTNARFTSLEGEIRGTKNTTVPSACYPPEADFLVRSRLRSEEVISSFDEFNDLRSNWIGSEVTNRFNVHWKEKSVDEK